MSIIFISYRREDTAGHAGRLYDYLRKQPELGTFLDVSAIDIGVDFVQSIENAIGSCDILLAIIGKSWTQWTDNLGRRRLDDPHDFVRLEIGTALRRGIRVVPVLVQGARLPLAEDLPEDLRPIVRRHAVELRDARWEDDVGDLIKRIVPAPYPTWPLRPLIVGVVAILLAAALGLWWFQTSKMELDTDRFGADYAGFPLPTDDPKQCEDACRSDSKCMAWTYIKPNTIRGPDPMCSLKSTAPPPKKDICCVSGIMRLRTILRI